MAAGAFVIAHAVSEATPARAPTAWAGRRCRRVRGDWLAYPAGNVAHAIAPAPRAERAAARPDRGNQRMWSQG